ncbi:restriction endonuclease subunit S [Pectobacterium zantedeschiae]|uniref:Restriction endonuclease subunit S n=1 Tax=Pectobacterium zantedeschiae TaxID=2034769 RepID=A0A9X8JLA9_9GAMM|nr:restriction endonuclease subunit S [Pectobacterium zantedeschiae]RYC37478.1 type I restriction endonuclease subunit S [Pectobacterium zantedeschiae]RYC45965.1 restriction endonuclease subunit S [Pectobacterium zantedeschiae]
MSEVKLPEGWAHTQLEYILGTQEDGNIIHQGWSPQCDREPAAVGEWGVLKTTAIQDGFFLSYENKRLPIDKSPKLRIEVKDGDLLVTNAGPRSRCGIICLVKSTRNKLMISGKMYRLRFPESSINSRFIESWLRTSFIKKELNDRKTGINESGLNMTQERFLTLPVIIAPLEEQKKIAEKLDVLLTQVDSIKSRLDQIPLILKKFRQSVLTAAVSGKLTEDWRKKSELINWKKGILGEFIKKPSYGSSAKSQIQGLVPVLRMGNIQEGKLDWSDLVFTSSKDEIEKYKLEPNDILFNRTNSPELVGKTSIFKGERDAIYAGYLIRIKCLPVLNPDFLNYHLNSPFAKDYCYSVKSDGVSQSNINAQKLSAYPLHCPPLEEQTEIVRRVEQLFTYADGVEKQVNNALERVNNLTQSILAKAFRGELTEQWRKENPELISGENSAEALLVRIKAERAAQQPQKKTRKKA